MRKTIRYSLKYIIPGILLFVLAWLFLLSRSAAMIFNHAMEQQDMLRGTITVEEISADITGYVEFEDLQWRDPNGEIILSVPEGNLRVRPWDIVTNRITSTTLQSLTLKNALVSLRFDEDMQVDFIRQPPSLRNRKKSRTSLPEKARRNGGSWARKTGSAARGKWNSSGRISTMRDNT